MGTFLILWNIALIIGQWLILGRDFEIRELLQLPVSVLFGLFTDLSLVILENFEMQSYLACLLSLVLGIFVLALGISFTVIADLILNSGEAFVKAISVKYHKDFGRTKVAFDVACVLISVILSLIFFSTIIGTREGTILSAIFTGLVVNQILKNIKKPLEKLTGIA